MSNALVSVVMPAYNAERFIGEALQSVIQQTYEPVEVIVVDDGSTDGSAVIAEAQGARLIHQPHAGVAAARNQGLRHARGDYWAILDADDLVPPDALERQVAELEQHPEVGMVFGLTEAFVTPGEPRPPHWRPAWDDGPFPWHTTAMLVRREVLEVVGGFDETMRLAEDMDWLARAKAAGVRAALGDYLALRYRIHSGNSTADARGTDHQMLRVLRASVRRQRTERADA